MAARLLQLTNSFRHAPTYWNACLAGLNRGYRKGLFLHLWFRLERTLRCGLRVSRKRDFEQIWGHLWKTARFSMRILNFCVGSGLVAMKLFSYL